MKKIIPTLFLIFTCSILLAQQPLSGTLNGDTLKAQFSPYHVIGNVDVIDLVIEPGVTILFDDNYDFNIDRGILKANGFFNDSIVFKPDPGNPNGWGGLFFKDCLVPSELKYCLIDGSSRYGIKIDDGLSPIISNSKITNNADDGIELLKSSMLLKNSIIENNNINGLILDDGQIKIYNSIITRNNNTGILSTDNRDSLRLINTVIADNFGTGLLSIANGIISIGNSIIYYNGSEISTNTSPDVTYSNIRGASVYPGIGNINDTPQFSNFSTYVLSPFSPNPSPCIDAGNPDIAFNDLYFPPSYGTSRNDMGAYGGPLAGEWYPPLYIQPDNVDFGLVSFDSTVTFQLTIKNYRDSTIIADSIYLYGNDTSAFDLDINNLNLNVSDSTVINVSFTPDRQGLFSASILFKTQKHGNFYVNLTGQGIVPEFNYIYSELDFDVVNLGDTLTLDFPIINSGSDTLKIDRIYNYYDDFILSDSSMKISPFNAIDTVRVSFIPDSIDVITDSLIFLSNDPDEERLAFPLFGQGFGPLLNIDSVEYNFGSVLLTTDTTLDISIDNNGNDTLSVDTLFLLNTVLNTYYLTDSSFSFPIDILADSSFILTFGFSPDSLGGDSAGLRIVSDDVFQPEINLTLSGNGIAPVFIMQDTLLDYGVINYSTIVQDTIIFTNAGNIPLNIYPDSLIISGDNPEYFSIDSVESYQILPDNSGTIYISFSAIQEGITRAELNVVTNDPIHPKSSVQLRGETYLPQIIKSENMLDFGTLLKDSVDIIRTYIHNAGAGNLLIFEDSLFIDGPQAGYFIVDSVENLEIQGNDSSFIDIHFEAQQPALNQAVLNIFSNDPDSHLVSIELRAYVQIPFIHLPRDSINFGVIPLGANIQESLDIVNEGFDELTIYYDSLDIKGNGAQYFTIDSLPQDSVVQPGDSMQIVISYSAAAAGKKDAMLKIRSDDALIPQVSVFLTGSSATPIIGLSSESIDFGTVPSLTDTVYNLSISNSGQGDLIVFKDGLTITGADASTFTISNMPDSNITLAPQNFYSLEITLTTENAGPKNAQLNIHSNDPDYPIKSVNLQALIIDHLPATVAIDAQHSDNELTYKKNGNLRFNISTNFPTDSVILYYREGGIQSFNKAPCVNLTQVNLWEITIDSSWITQNGFEYYVKVYHGWTFTDWPKKPKSMLVNFENVEYPFITLQEEYQQISIPFSTNQQSINTLFGDDLGDYDETKYRFFKYQEGTGYIEIIDLDENLPPGASLWLITKNEESLNFKNAKTLPTDTTFRLALQSGWNMIATPFAFPINWDDNDDKHQLRFYNSDGDWPFVSVLQPFRGYAVKVFSDTIVYLQPKEEGSTVSLAKQSPFEDFDWTINLKVEQNNLKDLYNFAGSKYDASEGIDKFDYYEPPDIGNYIGLYFTQENQTNGKTEKFSTDIKGESEDGYIFDFEVTGNVSGKKVLNLETYSVPEDYQYVVVNKVSKIKYPSDRIELYAAKNKLQLIVGKEEFVTFNTLNYNNIPTAFKLAQNYPNPFNPATSIKYQVPNYSKLSINVYNILGQRIKSLLKNEFKEAGYYQLNWDGTNDNGYQVATGIYILNFNAGHYSKSIKMVLQR